MDKMREKLRKIVSEYWGATQDGYVDVEVTLDLIHKEYTNSGYVKLSANQELPRYDYGLYLLGASDVKWVQQNMVKDNFRRVEIEQD